MNNLGAIKSAISGEASKYNRLFGKTHDESDYEMYKAYKEIYAHATDMVSLVSYVSDTAESARRAEKGLSKAMDCPLLEEYEKKVIKGAYAKCKATAEALDETRKIILRKMK